MGTMLTFCFGPVRKLNHNVQLDNGSTIEMLSDSSGKLFFRDSAFVFASSHCWRLSCDG